MAIVNTASQGASNISSELMQGDIAGAAGSAVQTGASLVGDVAEQIPIIGGLLGSAIDAIGGAANSAVNNVVGQLPGANLLGQGQ